MTLAKIRAARSCPSFGSWGCYPLVRHLWYDLVWSDFIEFRMECSASFRDVQQLVLTVSICQRVFVRNRHHTLPILLISTAAHTLRNCRTGAWSTQRRWNDFSAFLWVFLDGLPKIAVSNSVAAAGFPSPTSAGKNEAEEEESSEAEDAGGWWSKGLGDVCSTWEIARKIPNRQGGNRRRAVQRLVASWFIAWEKCIKSNVDRDALLEAKTYRSFLKGRSSEQRFIIFPISSEEEGSHLNALTSGCGASFLQISLSCSGSSTGRYGIFIRSCSNSHPANVSSNSECGNSVIVAVKCQGLGVRYW